MTNLNISRMQQNIGRTTNTNQGTTEFDIKTLLVQKKYSQNLVKNEGWMNNIDGMDGNQDGWLKADILYQQFPGLKKELPGITTKYENGSIFFKSSQMAKFITDEYNTP